MLNELLASLVHLVHWAVIAFVVYAPFSPYPPLWVLGTISLLFIMSHWCLPGPHQDTCALTLMERWLRGCECEDSFFHNIVSPIYKLVSPDGKCSDEFTGKLVWGVSIALALVGIARIALNWPRVRAAFTRCSQT